MNFYFLSYSIYTLSFLFQLISLLALEAYVWLKMFALYFCPNEEMELMNQMLGY